MPMSTSAELGSVPAREGGRVSMLTKGSLAVIRGEGRDGEGLDSRATKGSGAGASSMRSESGVVDMLSERMRMGDEVEWIAVGCLL